MRHLIRAVLVSVPLITLISCGSVATKKGFYEPITAELRGGNRAGAAELIEAAKADNKYAQKDRLIYFLDAGLLHHYAQDYETSNIKLHLAEAAAEELFTKSISRAAASLLLNDNVLEYSGEDYEVLYANLIKALNYVELGRFDEAFVEIRRANLKLELLERKYGDAAAELERGSSDDTVHVDLAYEVPDIRFHNDAFARYLSMHMYAADGKMDDARIDYDYLKLAFAAQPHIYDFPMPRVTYRSDGAILSVVGLTGLAPVKEALNLRLRTDKDLGLVQILYDGPERNDVEYGHLPLNVEADYYFKFAIPTLQERPSQVSEIRVLANGTPLGSLSLLEDIGNVAQETFAPKKALIYFRSVARAVVKGLAAHKLKTKLDTGGLEGWLKKAAVDVATDVTENADLRSSQYLPEKIFVGDFEIEPGTYQLTIQFLLSDGSVGEARTYSDYEVLPGRLNLIEAHSAQ